MTLGFGARIVRPEWAEYEYLHGRRLWLVGGEAFWCSMSWAGMKVPE